MVAIKLRKAELVACEVRGDHLEENAEHLAFRTARDAWRYVREAFRSEYRRVILVEWYDLPGGRKRVFEIDLINQPVMRSVQCHCNHCD